MADFSALKTSIQNYIKQNGNEEITGNLLQQVLLSMVTTLGDSAINDLVTALNNEITARGNADTQLGNRITSEAEARAGADNTLRGLIDGITDDIENGYVYAGIATPSTTPASGKVFYLALTAGTYTNFGNTVVSQGINILKYNGSAWSLDSFLGLDNAPTQGSNNLVKSGGVLDSIIKDGSAFDLSAYNSGTTYADLSAALTALNALPAVYKKGGMSIKYVKSSDNKYVQYRLMTDSWSIDTNDWSFCGNDVLVDNPEFVYVKTDSEDKILFGIKVDGEPYFGVGCPEQVKEYVEQKIADLSLDEYEDVVAFLSDYLGGDTTLKVMIDGINAQIESLDATKVDKEEGESLIDAGYASTKSTIDNPEFLEVTTDLEDKVLEGIKSDGTKVIGTDLHVNGSTDIDKDIKVLGDMEVSGVSYKVIENIEYLAAWVDAKDKVLFGLKADGKTYVGDADFLKDIKDNQDAIAEIKTALATIGTKVDFLDVDALSSITAVENPEFIEVKTDLEGKLLAGRTPDGKAFENVGFSTTNLEVAGIDITDNAEAIDCNTAIEDIEGRSEIITDSEGKIISYRGSDGAKHEEIGVVTNHLELTEQGMTDFQQALKDAGFNPGGTGDYTDKDSMYIPEPRIAHLNIITDYNLTNLSKTSNIKCAVEFFDGAGNFFRKYVILNGQGRSSLQFKKKGLGMDFFNENPNDETFDEDNTFAIKFGDWVYQDSFHIKSYYTDWPRCTTPVVYKLAREVKKNRGLLADAPYKKYYVGEYTDSADINTPSDLDKNMETGAMCIPDGFPVIVYQNGMFWGVNSWQLKKHRDNYMLSKKKATNIHLDGDMGVTDWPGDRFWDYNGTINWNHFCSGVRGIEIRNPKNLYCIDGKKYDADTHDAEIITTATAEEWIAAGQIIPTGKTIDDTLAGYLRTTGKVRKNIEDVTTYIPYIQGLADGSILIDGHRATTEEIRSAIADRFDIESFIDFILISNVVGDTDCWDNNAQIVTWGKLEDSDNLNWSVNIYDCDCSFGAIWNGTSVSPANNTKYGNSAGYPLYKIFWDYYYNELTERYKELRDSKIFDADHIVQLFRDWMSRVGYDNYEKEYDNWPDSPCFRDGTQTYVDNPTTGGFYGSIYRIYLWVKKRIEFMDAESYFNYNQN